MNYINGKKNIITICMVLLIFLILFFGNSVFRKRSVPTLKETRIIMGTMFTITAYYKDMNILSTALNDAFSRIAMVDNNMSTYKPQSELSKLNQAKKPGIYAVSDDLWNVLLIADQLYHQTNGVFDVTIKPLLDLWHDADQSNIVPAEAQIEKVRSRVGWQTVFLHPDTHEIEFTQEGTMIVLGGVAKGYAVDMAVEVLHNSGIMNCIVDGGGDIYCSGIAPEGTPWNIGIRNPFDTNSLVDTLLVRNEAVVTSGNYERFFSVAGKRFSQIINPQTGYPTQHTASVTLRSSTTAIADGLATALMIILPDKGVSLIEKLPHTEVFIITTTDEGEKMYFSSGFKK